MRINCTMSSGEIQIDSRRTSSGRGPTLPILRQVTIMAKQSARIGADGIRIPLKRGDAKAALPAQLAGTLVLMEKTGDGEVKQAFDVSAKLDPAFVPASSLAAAEGSEPLSLIQALLFALLGGLILNLMPCVFPVLAMKAAAFVRHGGRARSAMLTLKISRP